MSNPTRRMVEVYEMMKDGAPIKFDDLVTRLGCKPVTAMVLICALRSFKAEIDTIRDGRKVESYQLTNAADIATTMASTKTKTKAVKTAKVKTSKMSSVVSRKAAKNDEFGVPTIDPDLDVTEVSEAELADLRNQLGLA